MSKEEEIDLNLVSVEMTAPKWEKPIRALISHKVMVMGLIRQTKVLNSEDHKRMETKKSRRSNAEIQIESPRKGRMLNVAFSLNINLHTLKPVTENKIW